MDVLILFNAPVSASDSREWASEVGVLESVDAADKALTARGHHVRRLAIAADDASWIDVLRASPPDVVFNLAESALGRSSGEALVAATLELLGLPFTGSTAPCLALVHDKPHTKWLLEGDGILSPEFVVVRSGASLRSDDAQRLLELGPVMVKPAGEDASLGISAASVVSDEKALYARLTELAASFGDVLVERFVDGREINVAIVALPTPRVLPAAEIEFELNGSFQLRVVTYDAKWNEHSDDFGSTPVTCPATLDSTLEATLRRLALAAFRVTGCRDYARVDFRIDPTGRPYVLEVNANPDIGPGAGLARAWRVAGREVDELYVELAENAATRAGVETKRAHRRSQAEVTLRPMASGERARLVALVQASNLFRADEVVVADEVLRDAENGKDDGHYRVLVAADSSGVASGFACWGPVPMTDATWDLYWIVVDPELQDRGNGGALLAEVASRVQADGGRWLLAETSSTPDYLPTRRFYVRHGYAVVSSIADYYRTGDGRVTFGKRLDS